MSFLSEIERRRTFGIVSHPDAGKTTLTEKLLLFGGAIQEAGAVKSNKIKKYSLDIYNKAYQYAYNKGIIIADTKFEFGIYNNRIILIDELLTPDSSRFWGKGVYKEGQSQPSYDKQIIRDYLLQIGWDKNPPIPDLPQGIIDKTSRKYQEVYNRLFG